MIEILTNNLKNPKKDYTNDNIEYQRIGSQEFLKLLNTTKDGPIKGFMVTDQVIFSYGTKINTIVNIKECHFESGILFNGCDLHYLTFEKCTSNGAIHVLRGDFTELVLSEISCEQVKIEGGQLRRRLIITWDILEILLIVGGNFKEGLFIHTPIGRKEISKLKMLQFMPQTIVDFGKINIYNVYIKWLAIRGHINGYLSINNILFNKFELSNFYNLGTVLIRKIKSKGDKSYFFIESSELNNCTFSNIDFKNISVEIKESNVTTIKTNDVNWFEKLSDSKKEPSINRENYRQLKNAMLNQGNKIQALEFEAKELYYHHKSLKGKKGKGADKFILFTNRINNHGQNWWRATWVFFLLSCGFYTLIKMRLGHTQFEPLMIGYDIGGVFSLMNPAHSTEILKPDIKTSGGAFMLDSIFRIISAYFIFQIVVAFRKFVNR